MYIPTRIYSPLYSCCCCFSVCVCVLDYCMFQQINIFLLEEDNRKACRNVEWSTRKTHGVKFWNNNNICVYDILSEGILMFGHNKIHINSTFWDIFISYSFKNRWVAGNQRWITCKHRCFYFNGVRVIVTCLIFPWVK